MSLINLLTIFEEATPQEVITGMDWYHEAHELACSLRDEFGVSLDVAAGVIAALSPRSKWERNMADAGKVIAAFCQGRDPMDVPVGTFNRNKEKKEVSRLDAERREEMEKEEAKRKARKAARESKGPLLEDDEELASAGEPVDAVTEDDEEAQNDEDDRPDLLLRESARIVADMVVLSEDELALERQFSQLNKDAVSPGLN